MDILVVRMDVEIKLKDGVIKKKIVIWRGNIIALMSDFKPKFSLSIDLNWWLSRLGLFLWGKSSCKFENKDMIEKENIPSKN